MSYNLMLPTLQAKLKSMYSKMLSVDEYKELIMLENLKDITNLLKQKFPMLENLNESMGRKEIEVELSNLFLFNIKKIYTYLSDEEKDFCDLFLSKYVIIASKDADNKALDGKTMKLLFDKTKGNKKLRDIVGTEIDILNLQWIYRSKKYFMYDDNEIENILIPVRFRLTPKVMKELIETDDERIYNRIQETEYKEIVKNENSIYLDCDRFLYKKNLKYFRKSNLDFVIVICYFNLLGFEIKNIINIIESIRYKSNKEELQNTIIV